MTFWDWLYKVGPGWPDARGLIGTGVYVLVLLVLALLALDPELRKDEFFKTIATLIVGAFIKDVVGWVFQLTKGGTDLADRNAKLVEGHASGKANDPVHTKEES